MKDDLCVLQGLTVVLEQTLQSQGMGTVQAGVHELFRSGSLVEVVGQGFFPAHILPPYEGVADHEGLGRIGGLSAGSLEEPVILAGVVRDAIIGGGFENLDPVPDGPGEGRQEHEHQHETHPLAGGKTHFVARKACGSVLALLMHRCAQNWK
jgi:hypothetical protein